MCVCVCVCVCVQTNNYLFVSLFQQITTTTKLSSKKSSRSKKCSTNRTMAGSTESECTEAQTSEINRLKEIYGKQCKVIKDIGDFSHVVEVKLGEADCSVKFQLEGESRFTLHKN